MKHVNMKKNTCAKNKKTSTKKSMQRTKKRRK